MHSLLVDLFVAVFELLICISCLRVVSSSLFCYDYIPFHYDYIPFIIITGRLRALPEKQKLVKLYSLTGSNICFDISSTSIC